MPDIASTWMRGGTSKCWVFERSDLEAIGEPVDALLLRLFGSPDHRQVDGVGGGTSTTSKAVILSQSGSPDADVDYTFAQVGIDQALVDWGSNCGNCSSVVGPYAVRRGWVQAHVETTAVRVRNTNTGQLMVMEVPTPNGVFAEDGRDWISGVPFSGSAIRIGFVDPAGRTTGRFLPTGNPIDRLGARYSSGGESVEATLLDAGSPLVVLSAKDVGLLGNESPEQIAATPGLLDRLDALRREAAVVMGIASSAEQAERAIPKLAMVAPPAGERADLVVRMLSMGQVHPAIAITGSIGLTLAAHTEGTVVAKMVDLPDGDALTFDTPAGVVTTWTGEHEGRPTVAVTRTARTIAEAKLMIPRIDTPAMARD